MMLTSLLARLFGKRRSRLPQAHDERERTIVLNDAEQAVMVGDYNRAIEATYAYLQQHAPTAPLLSNLGVALMNTGQVMSAEEELRNAIAIDASFAPAWYNLGLLLFDRTELDSAEHYYRRAVELDPSNNHHHHSLLALQSYREDRSQGQIVAMHREWGRRYEGLASTSWDRVSNEWPRRLRIGFVSADFFSHSTYYFISGALAHHDPAAVELVCYDNRGVHDAASAQLRSLVDHWRLVHHLDDSALETMIRDDAIDILVDLSGHTSGNRLAVFARKPAPLQVTWIGYPQTTGLSAMDYRLTDAFLDPPGEDFGTERPWRLPNCATCFSSPPQLEATSNRRGRSGIVFLSGNNYFKLSNSTVRVWARILAALPDSTLRVYARHAERFDMKSIVLARFAAAGISADQLDIRGWCATDEYFRLLSEVDIALDPFPYNGGTTTNLCLWAGLPVITLAGATPPSRCGLTLLSNLGLERFVARTEDEYVAKTVELAADPASLPPLRKTIREAYLQSPIFDSRAFARDLEAAFRSMWEQRLAGLKDEIGNAPDPSPN